MCHIDKVRCRLRIWEGCNHRRREVSDLARSCVSLSLLFLATRLIFFLVLYLDKLSKVSFSAVSYHDESADFTTH